ncbi:MAG: hypothetical protein D6772_13150 [Bacteroidetes bacterium]|nr:MAG: hypothetical protein D6772_13150 [Bacteroidota bacterium]
MNKHLRALNEELDLTMSEVQKLKRRMWQIGEQLKHGGFITYEQMSKLVPGVPFTELKGVISYRIALHEELIALYVEMQPDSVIGIHGHDCFESGHVVFGEVYVNDQLLTAPGQFLFAPEELHHLLARVRAGMIVFFKQGRPA